MGIALITGMDRMLDMSRTAINVSGNLVAANLNGLFYCLKIASQLGKDWRHCLGIEKTITEQEPIFLSTSTFFLLCCFLIFYGLRLSPWMERIRIE